MRKGFISFLIAIVALVIAGAVIILANPFKSLFDSVFFSEEELKSRAVEVTFTENDEVRLKKSYPEAKELIEEYFTVFKNCEGLLSADDDAELESLYLTMSADYLRDKLFLYSKNVLAQSARSDLSFSQCELTLHYTGLLEVNNSMIIVTLTETEDTYYGCLTGGRAAESDLVTHTFTLKFEHSWRIFNHTASGGESDFTNGVLARLYEADGYSSGELTYTYLEPYYKKAKAVIEAFARENANKLFSDEKKELPTSEYGYERESAVKYAQEWTSCGYGLRNLLYEGSENDSMNFISQCIFAGDIPMDSQGDDDFTQWKWYDKELSYAREKSGCTASWYDCERFLDYALGNTGFGLKAVELPSAKQLEIGDIVIFTSGEKACGAAIVTGMIFTQSGGIDEIFVCAHDPDRRNVPLSSIGSEGLRFIKILGYESASF